MAATTLRKHCGETANLSSPRPCSTPSTAASAPSAPTRCSAACQATPPILQLTQPPIPAARKQLQVPSGILLYTMSAVPRD